MKNVKKTINKIAAIIGELVLFSECCVWLYIIIIYLNYYKFRAHIMKITAATMDIIGTKTNEIDRIISYCKKNLENSLWKKTLKKFHFLKNHFEKKITFEEKLL